jgi:hypothetical protein
MLHAGERMQELLLVMMPLLQCLLMLALLLSPLPAMALVGRGVNDRCRWFEEYWCPHIKGREASQAAECGTVDGERTRPMRQAE